MRYTLHSRKMFFKRLNQGGIIMDDLQKLNEFFEENSRKLKNPIIQGFLSHEDNLILLKKYILNPSDINRNKVDKSFQSYYKTVREIKYVSNLIHFFSVDFDKKIRKQYDRNLLILDKNKSDEGTITPKEFIQDDSQELSSLMGGDLLEKIENKALVRALKTLSDKQIMILEMIYLRELSLKEISKLIQTSPQNISNHHRKTLKKLNKLLKKEEG